MQLRMALTRVVYGGGCRQRAVVAEERGWRRYAPGGVFSGGLPLAAAGCFLICVSMGIIWGLSGALVHLIDR
jgi:hypothetical protein